MGNIAGVVHIQFNLYFLQCPFNCNIRECHRRHFVLVKRKLTFCRGETFRYDSVYESHPKNCYAFPLSISGRKREAVIHVVNYINKPMDFNSGFLQNEYKLFVFFLCSVSCFR